jgi:hypothetical protein
VGAAFFGAVLLLSLLVPLITERAPREVSS